MKENLLDKIIDRWWNILILLGCGFVFISMAFKADFLKSSYIFGMGIGIILIGISFSIATSEICKSQFGPCFMRLTQIKHTLITKIILSVGLFLTIIFFFLILFDLITK
jgi:hypothetical protein